MFKYSQLLTLILACAAFFSCTDNTNTLGVDMMPTADIVTPTYKTYYVGTKSIDACAANLYADSSKVGGLISRTNMSYFGRFTDTETKTTTKAEFVSQFHTLEQGRLFPDSIHNDKIEDAMIFLYISDFIGDSLKNFKLDVYELDKKIDSSTDLYTNFNPQDYIIEGSKPIATKWFTINDHAISDSVRATSDYMRTINIQLPVEIGQKIYDQWKADSTMLCKPSKWLNSGLPLSKGLYFKLSYGDGAIAYIDISQIGFYFHYYDTDLAKDTSGVAVISGTEEVIQANRFENEGNEVLLKNDDCTYIKSPAGIYTEVELPVDSISEKDSVNLATLTLTRYNDETHAKYKSTIPKTLLLVSELDYKNGYFEKYSIPDGETSFTTTFASSTNTYTFNNIARLMPYLRNKKKQLEAEGKSTDGWNKLLLIPIKTSTDSSNNIVKIMHDFSFSSAKLVGGPNNKAVELKVLYSSFNF